LDGLNPQGWQRITMPLAMQMGVTASVNRKVSLSLFFAINKAFFKFIKQKSQFIVII
jgi:hypothetical protein